MILLIDNYDSFVYNLARYIERLGQPTTVVRNDEIDVAGIRDLGPAAIILSPGPCTPREAGCSLDIVRQLHPEYPILGVCLGHQAIAAAFGAQIIRADEPMHGRTSSVFHRQSPLFDGVDCPFIACRYHSLVVDPATLPAELAVTATCDDGTVMAIEHSSYPLAGVQFHPEAVLTEFGFQVLWNFLHRARLSTACDLQHLAQSEVRAIQPSPPVAHPIPVTF